jgi:hypothetical protein
MRRQAQRLEKPYPATADPRHWPDVVEADWQKSYDLARRGIIETLETGARGKIGLVHKTCAKLGVDPNN